jgi:dipeptidyl aminopeptidase/acylaminoacyl peptidase
MRRCVLLLLLALPLIAQKRAITHEDVWLMKRAGEPVVSPDGRQVVFQLTEPDYDPAKQTSDLWIVPADGSAPARRLTATRAAESGPVWSPDGGRLAFSTRREGDEAPQIYVLPLNGGEAQRITSMAGGASTPQWRPDGKAILFESDFDPIANERKERKSSARVFDAMPVRYWNAWLDEKKPHLYTVALEGDRKPVDLLNGTQLAVSEGFAGLFGSTGGQSLQAVWAPDGQSVVFAALVNRSEMMAAATESLLFTVPAAGGECKALTGRGVSYSRPKFSPTGDRLFAIEERSPAAGGRLYSLARLASINWPQAGAPKVLTGSWDRSVAGFSITNDGSTVYIEAEDDGFDQIFRMAAGGGAVERLFAVKRGGYAAARPAQGGVVALYQTSAQPPEVVRVNAAAGTHSELTRFNAERTAQLDTPEPIHFWFTAKNGKRVHNIMFLPPRFDSARRHPLLIFPHGGPNSMSKDAFSVRWNNYLLASPGYVVLETNYTGSTGFGEKFADDIERDVLKGPAEEILEGIAEAIKRYPYIDGSRQAAAGASYGGYLMNWFNGHTNQFKCLVNHAGAINNESQYGVNDGGIERELRMGGPIWEKNGQWNEQSPIRYAGSFQTPTLITQGELDYRVPVNESITTFKILQRRKVPSRLVVFPDEGHWVLKGENSRLHMQEVMGWLKKYL